MDTRDAEKVITELEKGVVDNANEGEKDDKEKEALAPTWSDFVRDTPNPFAHMLTLPASVKRRLKALKKLQLETTKIEAEFYEEVHKLECRYQERLSPLYTKRTQVTKGAYEPTEDECDWPSDEESSEGEEEVVVKKEEKIDENVKGVPEFWLTIFKNVDIMQDMIQDHDEPLLKHLEDVTVTFQESDPMGFTLHFHFSPNEYFTDSVLTKEYIMKCEPSTDDPFSFEGPEIFKCKGCKINWANGKDPTVKTVKKKQMHSKKGSVRSLTKTIKNDSFFNFFDPPVIPEDPNADIDSDTQDLVSADFEIGHYIREKIVPRAVLFYTGEAVEEDDLEDESDEDEDEDWDEDALRPAGKEDCKQQ